jgi:ABC-type antimicrobial peptide transport system permease subunit
MLTTTSERLAEFNSVTNTYLSVFMLLSGLAMLIGTLGLGIVLLRNLAERKQEIALYQALGFTRKYIRKLIFAENLFILSAGIGLGLIAAVTGIIPSFFSPAFRLPAMFLAVLLSLIFLSGLAWIWFPVKAALRKNVIQALWQE